MQEDPVFAWEHPIGVAIAGADRQLKDEQQSGDDCWNRGLYFG